MSDLDELYLDWLCSQIAFGHGRTGNSYSMLTRILLAKDFVWVVANDDNRVSDGLELRGEFLIYLSDQGHDSALRFASERIRTNAVASVLEVIIGLSRRLSFLAEGSADHWAWQLIENIGLQPYYDPVTQRRARQIDNILDRLIWRNYASDGVGGFFPMSNPEHDQRKVEIWYQMSEYISENLEF